MKLEVKSITKINDKTGKPHELLILEYDKPFRDWICGSEGWDRLTKKRLQNLINYAVKICLDDWLHYKKGDEFEIN